ncbi:acyltransferase family protein [Algibacter sp. L1A34]|uniref:acyltransferase family protein n=1 Tax=Algibacter sp. L1A34 TaxID=2686365 RepID=UPI00131B74F9|nr:acyltransferase family protein [Algibacter sp. L1A34]
MLVEKKRIYYIDIAKSIGITLVVFGHTYNKHDFLYNFIYSFHMPLFFLLSGMFSKNLKKHSIKPLLIKRFNNLILPYLFFYILTYLYWVFIESKFRPGASDIYETWYSPIIGVFYGGHYNTPLWFIPCLLSIEIMNFYVQKFKNFIVQLILVFLFFTIGFYVLQLIHLGFDLPFQLFKASISLLFFYFGKYFMKLNLLRFFQKGILLILMIIIYTSFILDYIPNTHLLPSYNTNLIYILIAFFTIAMLLLFVDLVAYKMNMYWSNTLSFFGINSLVILCIHDPIKRVIIFTYSVVSEKSVLEVRTDIVASLICTLIVMLLMLPTIYLYKKIIEGKLLKNLKISL